MATDSRETFKSPLCEAGALVRHKDAWFLLNVFPNAERFDEIRNFPVNDEDIILASYPKSGSFSRNMH